MSPRKAPSPGEIIFVSGTDTGVGKTVLTAMLLHHLRQSGVRALAMKPFCSGNRSDAALLTALQDGELLIDEVNPFYFQEPVAPLIAGRQEGKTIDLKQVMAAIRCVQGRCERLLVEGVGGLLSPLGEGYSVADLISELACHVIVVSRNRLGTISHTRLTVAALDNLGLRRIKVVLMGARNPDRSSASNHLMLSELLHPVSIFGLRFLGPGAKSLMRVRGNCKKAKKTLAEILEWDNLVPASGETRKHGSRKSGKSQGR